MTYGSQVYFLNKTNLHLVEQFQKRVIRWITGDYTSSYKELLIQLNVLPLGYFLHLRDIMLLCNITSINDLPSMLTRNHPVHTHNTRSTNANASDFISIPFSRIEQLKHNYYNRVRLLLLITKISIADCTPINKFNLKRKCIAFLFDKLVSFFDSTNSCTWTLNCSCTSFRGTRRF